MDEQAQMQQRMETIVALKAQLDAAIAAACYLEAAWELLGRPAPIVDPDMLETQETLRALLAGECIVFATQADLQDMLAKVRVKGRSLARQARLMCRFVAFLTWLAGDLRALQRMEQMQERSPADATERMSVCIFFILPLAALWLAAL